MDGGELQDATKLSDIGRRLTVERDAFTMASKLTGSRSKYFELVVLQASDKNINRYSNVLRCSSILQYFITAQHPLAR